MSKDTDDLLAELGRLIREREQDPAWIRSVDLAKRAERLRQRYPRPPTHQVAREGDRWVSLCGATKPPIYLTDHARPLAPNGPVTCDACLEALASQLK